MGRIGLTAVCHNKNDIKAGMNLILLRTPVRYIGCPGGGITKGK
nr:MAG TPA: hypothetical protein [Caudoviricetes sp.]